MRGEVWTALAEVRPGGDPDALEGAPGAFVPVAGRAVDERDLVRLVARAAQTLGLELVEVEEAKPAPRRAPLGSQTPERRELIDSARESGEVQWGSFHAFESEDG